MNFFFTILWYFFDILPFCVHRLPWGLPIFLRAHKSWFAVMKLPGLHVQVFLKTVQCLRFLYSLILAAELVTWWQLLLLVFYIYFFDFGGGTHYLMATRPPCFCTHNLIINIYMDSRLLLENLSAWLRTQIWRCVGVGLDPM